MPVVYAGVGWGDEHDGRAGCGRGSVERALVVVGMLAQGGDGCKDEGAATLCDGAGKGGPCVVGVNVEGDEILMELVPVVADELSAGLCLVVGGLSPFCTGLQVGNEVVGGVGGRGGLCEESKLSLDVLEAFSGCEELLLEGLLVVVAGGEKGGELGVGGGRGGRRGRRGRHRWQCLGRDGHRG